MKIKTIIVDDEPHAIEVIENYLQNFASIEVVARCPDAINAFQILQQKNIDLVFLDVKMPGLKGTDLLKSLKNRPKVIFTTAYSEYAVEGFDLEAVDYLLKPVAFDRFLRAMEKVFNLIGVNNHHQIAIEEKLPFVNKDVFLYLKVDRKMVKVNVSDILWIESLKDYIKVVLSDRILISKQKISLLEELLPEDRFVRIHRSFIVSVAKVESYYSYAVEIAGRQLPIGRNYKNDTYRRIKVA